MVHLQTRLHDEKTLRMGLEQALGEASDPCTPQDVSAGLAPQVSPMDRTKMSSSCIAAALQVLFFVGSEITYHSYAEFGLEIDLL